MAFAKRHVLPQVPQSVTDWSLSSHPSRGSPLQLPQPSSQTMLQLRNEQVIHIMWGTEVGQMMPQPPQFSMLDASVSQPFQSSPSQSR